MYSRPYLFSDYDLRSFLDNRFGAAETEIDTMEDDRLLNTSLDDLVVYLVDKYQIDPLVLDDAEISVDQQEKKIDVSGDSGRHISDRSKPFHIKGTSNIFLYHIEETQHYLNVNLLLLRFLLQLELLMLMNLFLDTIQPIMTPRNSNKVSRMISG